MKKRYALVALILCLCAIFTACSGQEILAESGKETEETAVIGTETETEETEYPAVPHVTTWDEINAIPVATPDMTIDQLRQICVDYAVLQQSFQWTPTHDLDYMHASGTTKLHCEAGTVYGGLPYGSGGASLYSAMDYYDETTGVLDTSSMTGKSIIPLSNHCSSSIRWAFGRVSTNMKYTLTNNMIRANGCIPLGPYKYQENIQSFAELPTKDIVAQNGEQVMFRSYALLDKADGVVTYGTSHGGHTRMITEKATVVKNADGTIDGNNSYVYSVEQYSTQTNTETDQGMIAQHGETRKKYTFAQMYNSGYLPFTIPEFCGMAKVERAWAKLDTDSNSAEALQDAALTSNYMIAKVSLTAYDKGGAVVSSTVRQTPSGPTYSYPVSSLFSVRNNAAVKGAARVVIEAFVASGENITVFDGTVD